MRYQTDQCTFQLADVRANVRSDVKRHIRRDCDLFLLGFLLKNRHLRLKVWRLDIRDESPFKPAAQAVFDFGQFFWRTVTSDDDLFHRLVQRIKRVKELFLGTFLLGEELDIIHQQHVNVAKLVAKTGHLVVAQRVDHFVSELLAGYVADGCLTDAASDLVSDGLHEMGLAHANTAVQEQRVVSLGRTFRNRLASGVGELVAIADDKGIESVARIELSRSVPIKTRLAQRAICRSRRRSGDARGKSSIMTNGRCRRVVFGSDKFHILVLKTEIIDCFLDQICVLVTDMAELGRGHPNKQNSSVRVTVSRRFQPCVIRVPIDLFLQGIEDADPRIGSESSCARRRHKEPYWRGSHARLSLKCGIRTKFSEQPRYQRNFQVELPRTSEQMGILAQNFCACGNLLTKILPRTLSFSNSNRAPVK